MQLSEYYLENIGVPIFMYLTKNQIIHGEKQGVI